MARGIHPIVKDPIGNGLQDKASDAMVKHRANRKPVSSIIPIGERPGSLLGGAPDTQG